MNTKNCAKCKQDKQFSEFHRHNKYPDKLFRICKLCRKEQDRNYYLSSDKKSKLLIKNKKFRKEVFDLKKKTKCLICQEDDPFCLDYHHLRDKIMEVARCMLYGRKRTMDEISKCVLLCANCHRKLHGKRFSLLNAC